MNEKHNSYNTPKYSTISNHNDDDHHYHLKIKLNTHNNHKSTCEKISHRVKQRNAWPTFHSPTKREIFKMIFDRSSQAAKVPSQKYLDEHFPIHSMDWDLIQSFSKSFLLNNNNNNNNDNPIPKNSNENIIQSTWFGHATVLLQVANYTILTDPIFSKSCSPIQFLGPKRFRDPPCTLKQLLVQHSILIDVVLISHNHYDHLDYNTIRELVKFSNEMGKKDLVFVVPLGLKDWFEKYIRSYGKFLVYELDWDESLDLYHHNDDINSTTITTHHSLHITSVPMQHWSHRTPWDKDQSLWCGFVVECCNTTTDGNSSDDDKSYIQDDSLLSNKKSLKFIFCGDTGFFDGVHDIGKRYGPFDLALIPIGAYEPRYFMKYAHINPNEAITFMEALEAKHAFPIHWGTFPLAFESAMQPRLELKEDLERRGKDIKSFETSLIGETKVYSKE